jgi:hypothetical protein
MRFRPRFSVRTLAIFVTLVCVYFAAWEATKTSGVIDILPSAPSHENLISPIPLVLSRDVNGERNYWRDSNTYVSQGYVRRQYFIWLFGPIIKLPYESELK